MDNKDKIRSYRWLVFAVISLAYILVYFHRLCTAVVAVDMMNDLHAGGALLGLLGAAYFYPYAIMQFPSGLLTDSIGPRRTIIIFFFIAAAGAFILSAAPGLMWAVIGRTLVGIGVAMLFVPAMKILAQWFRIDEFAFMAGLLIAMGGIGSLISTAPLAVLSDAVGWRSSFFIIGIFTCVIVVLVFFFVYDSPSDRGWEKKPVEHDGTSAAIPLAAGVRTVLSSPRFWFIAVWFFFTCSVFFSLGGLWGGPYLMHVYKMSKAEAGTILSMIAFGMIIGSPLLSVISNKIKARKPVIICAGFGTAAIMAVFTLYVARLPVPAMYALWFLLGVCGNSIVALGFTTTKELFPLQIAGTSTGLVNLFPFAGAAVFQPVLGIILENEGMVNRAYKAQGYRNLFAVLFICSIIAVISSLFFKETYGSENR